MVVGGVVVAEGRERGFGFWQCGIEFDVGHVPPKVSLALNFCATASNIAHFPRYFLLQIAANFTARHHFGDMLIGGFLQLPS